MTDHETTLIDVSKMPRCRKHNIIKRAVAHYYCEACAATGEATVGPAAAHETHEAPPAVHALREAFYAGYKACMARALHNREIIASACADYLARCTETE